MQIKFVFIFYNLQFPLEENKATPFPFRDYPGVYKNRTQTRILH